MKKSNAKKIDDKFGTNKDEQIVTGMGFPTYEEYERVPGVYIIHRDDDGMRFIQ